jgi:hypothetical protein
MMVSFEVGTQVSAMDNIGQESYIDQTREAAWGRYTWAKLCLTLLWFLGLAASTGATGVNTQNLPSASFGVSSEFAIADFDGDVRPDLASIQADPNDSGNTNYCIQFELSSVGRRSISLVAPAGGLSIEARDVNGDHAVDLVLATAWLREPVAIFLNNGHGGFLRAEPAAFPAAFAESKTNWDSASNDLLDAVGLLPQSRIGICPQARSLLRGCSLTTPIWFSSVPFRFSRLLVSHAGRAPPFDVLYI